MENNKLERNKEVVKRLYREVMLNGNRDAAEELMLESYKQHNPQAADGREGLLSHVEDLQKQFPNRIVEFIHLFAEGDYVTTHIYFKLIPGELEVMGMDVFRFEGDKIAEHWDVIQQIPEQSANDNKMF